ncbi:unnamed protein product, partial [Discosporangium mesarthrocarpum]
GECDWSGSSTGRIGGASVHQPVGRTMVHVEAETGSRVDVSRDGNEASNEEHDEESREVYFGSAALMVVGCRYYSGVAHRGEYVTLVREPRNPYDSNAIRVDNMERNQVGHVKRAMAAALTPLMDSRVHAPRLEALVTTHGQRFYDLPITVSFYGPPESADFIFRGLKRFKTIVRMGGGLTREGYTGYTALEPGPSIVVQKINSDLVKTQKELDEMFDKLSVDTSALPVESACALVTPTLTVTLLPHQREGLAWMVQRERKPDSTGVSWWG